MTTVAGFIGPMMELLELLKLEVCSGLLVTVLGARLLWARLRMLHASAEGAVHDHGFGPQIHTYVTHGGILAMGVSGGLVPCPEASGVLVAVGLGHVGLGSSARLTPPLGTEMAGAQKGLAGASAAVAIVGGEGRRSLFRASLQ